MRDFIIYTILIVTGLTVITGQSYSSGYDDGYKKCEGEYMKEWKIQVNELEKIRKDIKIQRKTVDSLKAIYN